MKPAFALLCALALAACVDTAAPPLADDHPANPRAASGLIEVPAAVSAYKTADDFAARAKNDAAAPAAGGHRHE